MTSLSRHWLAWQAKAAGLAVKVLRSSLQARRVQAIATTSPGGISVVIPSRDGLALLQRALPPLLKELEPYEHEVIVSDNGSADGTAAWLASELPQIQVVNSERPLSFARAVNQGLQAARYSHALLFNNDMIVEANFMSPLLQAFETIPGLFCATPQIHFPPGVRREETGKAVFRRRADENDTAFPVHCIEPIAGENLTWVLYGSGGCSLYDREKLDQLGGVGELYEPAYVEDLDLGYRAWLCGWPTVFIAPSQVVHEHRATTSRFFSEVQLETVLEINWLRFLARSVADPIVFSRRWRESIERLDRMLQAGSEPASYALRAARQAPRWVETPLTGGMGELAIEGLASGDVAVFPLRTFSGKPVVLRVTSIPPSERLSALLREAASDFDQILLTGVDEFVAPPVEIAGLCCAVIEVQAAAPDQPGSMRAALIQAARQWRPSLVELSDVASGALLGAWSECPNVVVDLEPVETHASLWQEADAVITGSAHDKLGIVAPGRIDVISSGSDDAGWHEAGQQQARLFHSLIASWHK